MAKASRSLSIKLVLPFILIQVFLLFVFIALLSNIDRNQEVVNNYASAVFRFNTLVANLNDQHNQIETNLLEYRFDQNRLHLQLIEQYENGISETIGNLTNIVTTKEERELIDYYSQSLAGADEIRGSLVAAIDSGDEQQIQANFKRWTAKSEQMNAALADLVGYELASLEQINVLYQSTVKRIYIYTLGTVILSALSLVIVYLYVRKLVTVPITKLSQASNKLSAGEFNVALPVDQNDEIGGLARDLSEMAQKLKLYYADLERQVRAKERQIKRRRELEERKDEFISIASHELKTPLTTIKGFTQLLSRELKDSKNPNVSLYLDKTNTYISRLERLIAELLDVSRIQAGKLEFNLENLPYDELVDEAVLATRHAHPNIKIIKRGKSKAVINGDRERLDQVFSNLFSNAIKYSPEADKVEIFVRGKDGYVETAVRDYGIGIPKAKQKKLFSRFYRVDSTAKKFSGLGIGLYIAHEIVRRHGGSMRVESEPEKGSIFYFSLPVNNDKI